MPEATLEAFRNLWFHTGDRGRFDEDGYLYFIDRVKDCDPPAGREHLVLGGREGRQRARRR